MVGQSAKQFDEDGKMTNEMGIKLVTELMDELHKEVLRMRRG